MRPSVANEQSWFFGSPASIPRGNQGDLFAARSRDGKHARIWRRPGERSAPCTRRATEQAVSPACRPHGAASTSARTSRPTGRRASSHSSPARVIMANPAGRESGPATCAYDGHHPATSQTKPPGQRRRPPACGRNAPGSHGRPCRSAWWRRNRCPGHAPAPGRRTRTIPAKRGQAGDAVQNERHPCPQEGDMQHGQQARLPDTARHPPTHGEPEHDGRVEPGRAGQARSGMPDAHAERHGSDIPARIAQSGP
jgi:hypothetical protein